MRSIVLWGLLSLLFLGCDPVEFYISPEGNDLNRGTRNQPFATVHRAQEAVRARLRAGYGGNITVWLGQGNYLLNEPLKFEPGDSGTGESVVAYKAVAGSQPVISGGMPITGWVEAENGIWYAEVPSETLHAGFRELFVDGKRAIRARHPDAEYLRVAETGADRRTNFRFNAGEIPGIVDPGNTELVLLHDWSITRIRLAGIDDEQNRITLVDSVGSKELAFFNIDGWEKDPRYFLENDRAFLDAPGEWFLNREAGVVYMIFPEGTDPQNMEIVVPHTGPHLVEITGSEQQLVHNLHFEGITFRYCSWQIPEMGYAGVQACHYDPRPKIDDWPAVPAAVSLLWAENCSFAGCRFLNLGGSGLWMGTGCRSCSVTGSHFEDISGNGIMAGEGRDRKVNGKVWWQTAPHQVAEGNVVTGNTVTAIGKQFYGAVGIWCGLTASTKVTENHVYELPYSGISIGWEWSPTPTPCRNNLLSDNHIHHIMQILSDGGGIYMLGLQPGSTISGNLIHDVTVNAGRAESNGMFLDEGTTDVTISGNIIYNIARSPLRFHRATINLVKDNILSCGDDIPPVRYNATREEDIRLENNTVLLDSDPDDRTVLEQAITSWKSNQSQTGDVKE